MSNSISEAESRGHKSLEIEEYQIEEYQIDNHTNDESSEILDPHQLNKVYRKLDLRIIPALWCLYF